MVPFSSAKEVPSYVMAEVKAEIGNHLGAFENNFHEMSTVNQFKITGFDFS
jgi:hypothetical protein